jgi:hypothetical protein
MPDILGIRKSSKIISTNKFGISLSPCSGEEAAWAPIFLDSNNEIFFSAEPHFQLLIEDDGVGFKKTQFNAEVMGNNIGMNIMQERATRIGAHIEIESIRTLRALACLRILDNAS